MPSKPVRQEGNLSVSEQNITGETTGEVGGTQDIPSPQKNEGLKILSATGPGVKKINDNTFEITGTTDIDDTEGLSIGNENLRSLSPKEQQEAGAQVIDARQRFSKQDNSGSEPVQIPSIGTQSNPDFNKPDQEESTPLLSDAAIGPGPAGGKILKFEQPTTSKKTDTTDSEQIEPDKQVDQDQENERMINMQQVRQISRMRSLMSRRKSLNAEIDNLEKSFSKLSIASGFSFLRMLMPALAGKINDVIGSNKQSGSQGRMSVLQNKSEALGSLAGLLLLARIFAGAIDGVLKYISTWVPIAAPIYWGFIVTAIIDILIIGTGYMLVFIPVGGELSRTVMQVRKYVLDLKETIDNQIAGLKKINNKKRQIKNMDSMVAGNQVIQFPQRDQGQSDQRGAKIAA